jgi:Uma2 family endonuclease
MQVQVREQSQLSETLFTGIEFMHLPSDVTCNSELVAGRIVPLPVMSMTHDIYTSRMVSALLQYGESTGRGVGSGGHLMVSTNPDTVRKPDAYFVLRERLADRYPFLFDGAPDLAVEVESKGRTTAALVRKAQHYLACGTQVVWLVHYRKRHTLTIYRAGQPAEVLTEDNDIEERDLLPGFRYPLRRLFAELGKPRAC